MSKIRPQKLLFQEGEAGWARWKNGGDPYDGDAGELAQPAATDFRTLADIPVQRNVTVIPYTGTEGLQDGAYIHRKPNEFFEHMPS